MKPALIALVLLAAGCGSRAGRPRVRIGNGGGTGLQIWALPATLADSLGYYREEGLDVTLENLSTGPKAVQALLGRSVDVAVYMYEHTVMLAAQGQRLRSFFFATQVDGKVLVVSPSAMNRIHGLSDLKGALIGVSAAVHRHRRGWTTRWRPMTCRNRNTRLWRSGSVPLPLPQWKAVAWMRR